MTPSRKLIEAEDALDFAIRTGNHDEVVRLEKLLPKLREKVQEERSRERIRAILQPLKYAFKR